MAIQKTINHYLEAVEKRFGTEARRKTDLQYRGGTKFVLRRANAEHPQLIQLARLKSTTKYLLATA